MVRDEDYLRTFEEITIDGDKSVFITVYPIPGVRGRYEYQFWVDGDTIPNWHRWFYEAFEPEEDGETWFWVTFSSIVVLTILLLGLGVYGGYICYKRLFKSKSLTYPDMV